MTRSAKLNLLESIQKRSGQSSIFVQDPSTPTTASSDAPTTQPKDPQVVSTPSELAGVLMTNSKGSSRPPSQQHKPPLSRQGSASSDRQRAESGHEHGGGGEGHLGQPQPRTDSFPSPTDYPGHHQHIWQPDQQHQQQQQQQQTYGQYTGFQQFRFPPQSVHSHAQPSHGPSSSGYTYTTPILYGSHSSVHNRPIPPPSVQPQLQHQHQHQSHQHHLPQHQQHQQVQQQQQLQSPSSAVPLSPSIVTTNSGPSAMYQSGGMQTHTHQPHQPTIEYGYSVYQPASRPSSGPHGHSPGVYPGNSMGEAGGYPSFEMTQGASDHPSQQRHTQPLTPPTINSPGPAHHEAPGETGNYMSGYGTYTQYGPYYPPPTTSAAPYQQSYLSNAGVMQSPGGYAMQPGGNYPHFNYANQPSPTSHIQSFGQGGAATYMHSRPTWQGMQPVPQAQASVPPQGQHWRPGIASSHVNYGYGRPTMPIPSQGRPRQPASTASSVKDPSSPLKGSSSLPFRPPVVSPGANSAVLPRVPSFPENASVPSGDEVVATPAQTRRASFSTSAAGSKTSPKSVAAGDNLSPGVNRVPGKGLRPHYHPQQGPRSDYVLWCGNVPHDTKVEELWELFSRLPPEESEEERIAADNDRKKPRNSATRGIKLSQGADDPDAGKADEKDVCQVQLGEEVADQPPAVDLATAAEGHGVLSIFIIARSNCAFVNYATAKHLERAVRYFHGKPVKPQDPRCPKLVCRVRKKDDEAQAGVAGQRGRGVHVAWLNQQKEQEKKRKAAAAASATATPIRGENSEYQSGPDISSSDHFPGLPPRNSSPEMTTTRSSSTVMGDPVASSQLLVPTLDQLPTSVDASFSERPPIHHDSSSGSFSSSGSVSFTSTNSSLFRHPAFRTRYFILKSLRQEDLERSIETGLWATQPHNEPVLDQAFRNSETVILIFSVNQSGEFSGYARMAGPILTKTETQEDSKSPQQRRNSVSGSTASYGTNPRPATIVEDDGEASDKGLKTHPTLDPGELERGSASLSPQSLLPTPNATTSSPLPITPSDEDVCELHESRGQHTLTTRTPRGSQHDALSSSWPFPSRGSGSDDATPPSKSAMHSTLPSSSRSREDPTTRMRTDEQELADGISGLMTSQAITVEPDEYGVKRRDLVGSDSSPSSQQSRSETSSLSPNDSASWPDPRAANQAAIRAVIHNLRLEERESMRKADELEVQLNSSSGEPRETGVPSDQVDLSPPRASSSDSWGKPFKVDWIQTRPLPFHVVRKLRNPWRDNRQVKVSRDGTELEPNVGKQVLEEWNKYLESDAADDPILKAKTAKMADVEDEDDSS
ncbi:hypothetical protein IE53DRAFT_95556 [Violaceomyces palustris]|uniref:Uncharacterized protein n=1 Tax=Violaceomyces palustris TaxID=1673888 RepID=A0ACD0P728_9BASI|nr:hypothetical protein IE53DRAFT_95556 [Violaceomyces palustris]